MADLTTATWAVLQAAHELQHGDPDASIGTSEIRAAALAAVNGAHAAHDFQAPGGTYAGIEAQIWALSDAGYVAVDVGMASATAPGHAAHVVEDDYGIRVTDSGRAALAEHATS